MPGQNLDFINDSSTNGRKVFVKNMIKADLILDNDIVMSMNNFDCRYLSCLLL